MAGGREDYAAGREAWHFWIRGHLVAALGETTLFYLGRYPDAGVARWSVHFEDRRPRFMLEVADRLIEDEDARATGQWALAQTFARRLGSEQLCVRVDDLGAREVPCWDVE